MKRFAFLVTLVGLAYSCSSDSISASDDRISGIDSIALSDSAKLFVLSTPLQVSTFLQMHAPEIHPEFLSDKSIPAGHYSTDYERALNLGVCVADIGYSALYGNRQLALDYLARADELIIALKIEAVARPYMERIRNNIAQRDSLSYLLLTLYKETQANLNNGKREKTAFYLVSGCYLENLAISMQYDNLKTNDAFNQLIAQEKMWLDNLAEALTYLEPDDESQDLYNTLFTIQDCYKDIPVKIENNLPSCTFTPEALAKLKSKSIQLRDEIIGKKPV
jgi:hypothetical protein